MQWLKLYYYPSNPKVVQMTDKYQVRSIISEMGLGDMLPKLLYVFESSEEIPWDSLPEEFVIKCNHGCAYNTICDNKKI